MSASETLGDVGYTDPEISGMRVTLCQSYDGGDITTRKLSPSSALSQESPHQPEIDLNEWGDETVFRANKYTVEVTANAGFYYCERRRTEARVSLRAKVKDKIVSVRKSFNVLDYVVFVDTSVRHLGGRTALLQVPFWLFLAPKETDDDVPDLEPCDPDLLA